MQPGIEEFYRQKACDLISLPEDTVVILVSPPGTGKTMIARRVPLVWSEASPLDGVEVCAIDELYTAAGLSAPKMDPGGDGHLDTYVPCRPFRAPHHTVSKMGLTGRLRKIPVLDAQLRPLPSGETTTRLYHGECKLANHGVLFLDDAPEFSKECLEVVRDTHARNRVRPIGIGAEETLARFRLVLGMNPCPCGFLGSSTRVCTCTPVQVDRYVRRVTSVFAGRLAVIASPLDRRLQEIDLSLWLPGGVVTW